MTSLDRELAIDKTSWHKVRLGDLATDVNDRVANPADSGYDRFVGLEHFVSGDLKIKAWQTTEGLVSAAKAFKCGDILLARRNAYLKRASMVDFDGICSGDAFVIREKRGKVVPGFLAFVVNSERLWSYAISNAAGTMSKRVKWRDLANYEFLLPPKDQQAKLAELLWAADAALETALETSKHCEIARHAFIAKSFNQKIDHLARLENLADVRYGLTLNAKRSSLPIQRPYLRVANVGREVIDLSELKEVGVTDGEIKTYRLELGDVLVVEGHANIHEIGRSSVWRNEAKDVLHQNHLIRIRCKDDLNPRFLSAYINGPRGKGYFQGMAKSTSGLNTINSTVVKELKVPSAKRTVQDQFVSQLDLMERNAAEAMQLEQTSKALLKSLINQIF